MTGVALVLSNEVCALCLRVRRRTYHYCETGTILVVAGTTAAGCGMRSGSSCDVVRSPASA